MPKFGVTVRVWDEGGFEIEADSLEEAREKILAMERDEIEERCEFREGCCDAEVEEEPLE
jgi:hypothetical protein